MLICTTEQWITKYPTHNYKNTENHTFYSRKDLSSTYKVDITRQPFRFTYFIKPAHFSHFSRDFFFASLFSLWLCNFRKLFHCLAFQILSIRFFLDIIELESAERNTNATTIDFLWISTLYFRPIPMHIYTLHHASYTTLASPCRPLSVFSLNL